MSGCPEFPGQFVEVDRNLPIAGLPAALPCPFCGSLDINLAFQDRQVGEPIYAHVECEGCGAETQGGAGGDASYGAAQEAARLWNMRAEAQATAVRIERLRQRLITGAMPHVETTLRALDQDQQLSEREVLWQALNVMDEVALALNEISGISGPSEDDLP